MTELVKTINIIYLFFLFFSIIFFSYQFLNNLLSVDAFVKVVGFSIGSIFVLLFSYKNSKKYFKLAIDDMGVDERIAVPTLTFVFMGGFSIALAITFISFIEALGLLFVVESFQSLILNVIALLCFFWLAFVLFIGWDFIKIASIVSQYSMIKEKRINFIKNMKFFIARLGNLKDAFLAFVAIDLACRGFTKAASNYYKNILFPVKIWSACLTLYDEKYVADAMEEAFYYFKTKSFKMFYTSKLSSFFLPMIIVPVGLSMGIIISNIEYFSNPVCLANNCFFVIVFFLIFMALGFFFSYAISVSLESAYYVKILNDMREGKVQDVVKKADGRINYIQRQSLRRISKTKNNFWDIFRIYF